MAITTKERAALMVRAFESRTRDNGEHYVCLTDGSPDWMTDVVRAAHDDGSILPDDWIFATVMSAAEFIADADDPDDGAHEWADAEVDVYTHDLMAWAARNVDAVDQVMEDEHFTTVTGAIMRAQYEVCGRIYDAVKHALDQLDAGEEG
jgi:hypothetical protein